MRERIISPCGTGRDRTLLVSRDRRRLVRGFGSPSLVPGGGSERRPFDPWETDAVLAPGSPSVFTDTRAAGRPRPGWDGAHS